jgi:hypothetical protein
VRTYNPQSHQWRLYWANRKIGILDPPQVGEFKDGRGEFFAQDTINGKTILIRYEWTNLTTNTPHFEQAFSDDGGKTWEVNFITDQTRLADETGKSHEAVPEEKSYASSTDTGSGSRVDQFFSLDAIRRAGETTLNR